MNEEETTAGVGILLRCHPFGYAEISENQRMGGNRPNYSRCVLNAVNICHDLGFISIHMHMPSFIVVPMEPAATRIYYKVSFYFAKILAHLCSMC